LSQKLTRAQKVVETDKRIFAALEALLTRENWEAVSVAKIAREAGLSVGAIYARAENHHELANALWTSRLKDPLSRDLNLLLGAAQSGDAEELVDAFTRFESSENTALISLELILASLFQPDMTEVIGSDFSSMLAEHIKTDNEELRLGHSSAVNMLVLSFAFGRLLALRANPLPKLPLNDARVLASFSAAEPSTQMSPPVEVIVRQTEGSERFNRDQQAALLERLERFGYSGATVSRLARSAGLTPGELFGRFSSKEELVAEICKHTVWPPGKVWASYVERSGDPDRASVRARFMRDFLAEKHRGDWRLTLELSRVSARVAALEEFKTPPDNLQRTHTGVMLVAAFFRGSLRNLPFMGPFQSGVAT
jgi:AcrR family transcriptional regulator